MVTDKFDLSGRHALVTAAVGPLGRALAVALAEAGATVSVTTLRHDRAEEVEANSILNECWSAGSEGRAVTLDLTDPAEVQTAVAGLERDLGPIEILVNAAHGAHIQPVLESSLEDWTRELNRNATSVFVACHAVGAGMVERGRGRIINVVSMLHDRGVPNCAIFGASQGAIVGFSKSLAIEWGRGGPFEEDRVTVNTITLGFFEDVPGPQQDPGLREVLERYVPLRRLGRASDLQGTVVYLASPHANFVTGDTIVVDGAIIHHA